MWRGPVLALLAACGRIGFEASAGDAIADAPRADTPSDSAALIPPGAKIWLAMETDAAVQIVDSAGGHASSCGNSGCPTRVPGVHGTGWQFSANEIDVAPAADLDPSAGYTAAVWMNVTAFPTGTSNNCAWSKPWDMTKVYDSFSLCVQASGQPTFDCEKPTGVTDTQTGPTMTTGQWHHVAITWDGTTKRDYFDGMLVGQSVTAIGAANQGVYLAGYGGSYDLAALLDDAVYYTRALTAAEIAQLATP